MDIRGKQPLQRPLPRLPQAPRDALFVARQQASHRHPVIEKQVEIQPAVKSPLHRDAHVPAKSASVLHKPPGVKSFDFVMPHHQKLTGHTAPRRSALLVTPAKPAEGNKPQFISDMRPAHTIVPHAKPATMQHVVRQQPAVVLKREVGLKKPETSQLAELKQPDSPKKGRFQGLKARLMMGGAVLLLGFGSYVLVDTLMINNKAKDIFTQPVVAADGAAVAGEGKDETPIKPEAVKAYKVSADLPRTITINKADVHARVLRMDVTADGAIQTPNNIFDTGWYSGSAKPGQQGAVFIDGHLGGPTQDGIFYEIRKLVEGDTITLERGDGKTFTYVVKKVETTPLEEVNMTKLLSVYGSATQGLNLMTCSGKYDAKNETYNERTSVFAVLQ